MTGWTQIRQVLPSVLSDLAEPRRRPCYDPPYDSPIEDVFAWHIVKYLDDRVVFTPQREVPTICGTFRLDFAASLAGRTIGLECDGADYHDEGRDELRDALILFDAGAIDAIYRLRGTDLHCHIHDLLFLLARYEPFLFSYRGVEQLPRLASEEVLRGHGHVDYRGALLGYGPREGRTRGVMEFLHMQRRALDDDPRAFRFERKFVAFARAIGGGPLEQVMSRWHEHLMASVA